MFNSFKKENNIFKCLKLYYLKLVDQCSIHFLKHSFAQNNN